MDRAGFETIAGMYNYTVRRGRQRGTTRLTGSTLMECWCILAVLKHRQGVGQCMFVHFRSAFRPVDCKKNNNVDPSLNHSTHKLWTQIHILDTQRAACKLVPSTIIPEKLYRPRVAPTLTVCKHESGMTTMMVASLFVLTTPVVAANCIIPVHRQDS